MSERRAVFEKNLAGKKIIDVFSKKDNRVRKIIVSSSQKDYPQIPKFQRLNHYNPQLKNKRNSISMQIRLPKIIEMTQEEQSSTKMKCAHHH